MNLSVPFSSSDRSANTLKCRLRLKEEVEILKHLSRAASEQGFQGGRHPNVLAYVDSWEEDEALFIQTELCELGNFARFLWEYGRVFPRLDEGRVWKIFADLSGVSVTFSFFPICRFRWVGQRQGNPVDHDGRPGRDGSPPVTLGGFRFSGGDFQIWIQ